MKKIISIVIVSVMLIMTFAFSSVAGYKKALPLSAGVEALRGQFKSAVASEEDGFAIDYCYYSPVGKSDNKKYPIVIFLHGIGHGAYKNSQLDDSEMAYWASRELQSRWTGTGGAFIILPRSPEDELQYWNKSLINPLRRMIDDFIKEHKKNVDTTRIFIGGSSAGGEMSWDMITTYPEYFAGAFPLSPSGSVTTKEIKKAKSVAIWSFASVFDPLVNYSLTVCPIWEKIRRYNENPQNCRFSTFGLVCNPDGKIAGENHRLFQTISYDLFTIDNKKYPNVTTRDGYGKKINMDYPNGIISWMNSIHSDYHVNNLVDVRYAGQVDLFFVPLKNYIFKIGNLIQKLLGFV